MGRAYRALMVKLRQGKWLLAFGLGLLLGLLWGLPSLGLVARDVPDERRLVSAPVRLPPNQVHPLPPSLLPPPQNPAASPASPASPAGDYFDQIQISQAGYLIWSRFPVRVYAPLPEVALRDAPRFSLGQLQIWHQAAQQAVREWQPYLPLELVNRPEQADIILQAMVPPERSTGRVRAGETTYKIFLDADQVLRHQMTVVVRPNQAAALVLATLRHELGHALGIWGHSPLNSDVLYFAQVAQSPKISARDINTLRRIYSQPTRLGWAVPKG
jgi:predicted Zn-dependent protease